MTVCIQKKRSTGEVHQEIKFLHWLTLNRENTMKIIQIIRNSYNL